jgi:hypothetical protein
MLKAGWQRQYQLISFNGEDASMFFTRSIRRLLVFAIIFSIGWPLSLPVSAGQTKTSVTSSPTLIWQKPTNIAARNLYYGSGNSTRAPQGRFKLIEVDRKGSTPKFVVQDRQGVRWKVKLGEEAQAETAATRLLWAVGYFVDETYYLPIMRVDGLDAALERGPMPSGELAGNDTLIGARLERDNPELKTVRWQWDWFENPFSGSRELDGLKVMMALINNWDLKASNNKVINYRGQYRYLVQDLGATFGQTGGIGTRSKNDLDDYAESRFIEKVTRTHVDLVMKSRPPFLLAVNVPYYINRTKMGKITEDIPRGHARWIAGLLGQLSDRQLRDAFLAANYSPAEARMYAEVLRSRIRQLQRL